MQWFPDAVAIIVEHSLVEIPTRVLTTYTWNVTLTSMMVLKEKCVYSPSNENPAWTDCLTEATVTSPLVIGSLVERWCMSRFKKNSTKAAEGLQFVLNGVIQPLEALRKPTNNLLPCPNQF